MSDTLNKLSKILQDKARTAVSAEGYWLVIKMTATPEVKEIFEEILFNPLGVKDPWYKLDWGRIRGSVYYGADRDFEISGDKVCIDCQDKVVMKEGNDYCLDCSEERRKMQNREAKRRQRAK